MTLPNCFIVGVLLCLVRPFVHFPCRHMIFQVDMILTLCLFVCFCFFAVSICPCLKEWYHNHLKMVIEYLETVKDFDELISPQSLFHHFLHYSSVSPSILLLNEFLICKQVVRGKRFLPIYSSTSSSPSLVDPTYAHILRELNMQAQ